MKYYGMAGLKGCYPNFCEEFDSVGDAVDCLAQIHELGRRRKATLRKELYLDLDIHRDGNEYCEIVESVD